MPNTARSTVPSSSIPDAKLADKVFVANDGTLREATDLDSGETIAVTKDLWIQIAAKISDGLMDPMKTTLFLEGFQGAAQISLLRVGAHPTVPLLSRPSNAEFLLEVVEDVDQHWSVAQRVAPTAMAAIDRRQMLGVAARLKDVRALRESIGVADERLLALQSQLEQTLYTPLSNVQRLGDSAFSSHADLRNGLRSLKDMITLPAKEAAETRKNNQRVAQAAVEEWKKENPAPAPETPPVAPAPRRL